VGTVSTSNTDDPALENKLTTSLTDTAITLLGTSIGYTIYSPFFPPYFPPYFPPAFCSCDPAPWPDGCTFAGYSCEGTISYEYYDCGCSQTCPGSGGYNQAYRNGVCGYVDPCAGYTCQAVNASTGCFKYDFIDCASPLPQCTYFGTFYGAYYFAYGDCNCNCPATYADFQYCMGVASC